MWARIFPFSPSLLFLSPIPSPPLFLRLPATARMHGERLSSFSGSERSQAAKQHRYVLGRKKVFSMRAKALAFASWHVRQRGQRHH